MLGGMDLGIIKRYKNIVDTLTRILSNLDLNFNVSFKMLIYSWRVFKLFTTFQKKLFPYVPSLAGNLSFTRIRKYGIISWCAKSDHQKHR